MEPVGVGGETFRVASLVFDLNGGMGRVQTGAFFAGVDGFVIEPGEYTEEGDFAGVNIGLFDYGGLLLVVPEPSTGMLVALGLLGLVGLRPQRRGA